MFMKNVYEKLPKTVSLDKILPHACHKHKQGKPKNALATERW